MNQNQVNKLQGLDYVYTQTTSECSQIYMCVSPADYDKIIKIIVTTSSYHFFYIAKPNHFQNKTKLESSYDTLRSLIINLLNMVKCLESIGMLRSTQKHEKTRFQNSAELTRSRHQDTRSCHPLQETLTRSCHLDARSCHLTSTTKCIFTFSRIKSCFRV